MTSIRHTPQVREAWAAVARCAAEQDTLALLVALTQALWVEELTAATILGDMSYTCAGTRHVGHGYAHDGVCGSSTCVHRNVRRVKRAYLNVKGWGRVEAMIDPHGTIMLWDAVAGHFTACTPH